jgi:hypothetical protein
MRLLPLTPERSICYPVEHRARSLAERQRVSSSAVGLPRIALAVVTLTYRLPGKPTRHPNTNLDGAAVCAVTPLSRRPDGLALAGVRRQCHGSRRDRRRRRGRDGVGGSRLSPRGRPADGRGSVRNSPSRRRTGGVGGGAPDLVYRPCSADGSDSADGSAVTELPISCSRPHGPRRTVDSLAARAGPELRTAVLDVKGSENFLNAPSGSLSLAQELLALVP